MFRERGLAPLGAIIFLLLLALAILVVVFKPAGPSFYYLLVFILPIIFLIAFFNADIALVILIFSMLLSPEIGLGGIKGRAIVLRVDDIFLLAAFMGWLAKMAVNKELGFLRATQLSRPVLVYIGICIFSSLLGVLQGTNELKNSIFIT